MSNKSLILFPADVSTALVSKGIEVDCTVSEGYKTGSTVTGYAVAAGFQVSDHTVRKNRIVNMQIQLGNHMFALGDMSKYVGIKELSGILLSSLGVYDVPYVALEAVTTEPIKRANLVHRLLTSIERQGLRCTLVTILGVYKNAVLVDYDTVQDKNSSTVLNANLTFELIETLDITSSVRAKVALSAVDEDAEKESYQGRE